MRDEVTVTMQAPPEKVWELLSDVTRIGEFSPETFEGEWLGGATGPEVGAHFRGHVKRNGVGPTYWTECVVTASVPGKEFGFRVTGGGRDIITWGYTLAEAPGGTAVTEYFALVDNIFTRIYWLMLGPLRGRTNRRNMLTTLQRIQAVVESR